MSPARAYHTHKWTIRNRLSTLDDNIIKNNFIFSNTHILRHVYLNILYRLNDICVRACVFTNVYIICVTENDNKFLFSSNAICTANNTTDHTIPSRSLICVMMRCLKNSRQHSC